MIYTIEGNHFGAFAQELAEMYRLRYRIFKERLNWDVTAAAGMEIDEYDALTPIYLLHCGAEGRVGGCVRLLPTSGPNMLRNSFPSLLGPAPAPQGPGIWEASRFAIDSEVGSSPASGGLSLPTLELFAGVLEFGLARDLSEIVAVVDMRMERILRRAGWPLRRIHAPQHIGNAPAVAGYLEVSSQILSHVQSLGGLHGSVLWTPARLKETA
jgi:acyl homoserine lactone synthase